LKLKFETFGNSRAAMVIGSLLVLASRLPLLLSPRLAPDGDECILGLMAKHLLETGNIPVFHYGQNYGFAVLETGTMAVSFLILGVSALAMKLSNLLLWSAGALFLALAVRRFAGAVSACIAGLLFILCPAWIAVSMKAWTGYVTAFVLAYFVVWLIAGMLRDSRQHKGILAAIGCCAALIIFSQPIWFLATLPFLVLLIRHNKRWGDLLALGAPAAAVAVILVMVFSAGSPAYWTPHLFDYMDLPLMIKRLPQYLWVSLTGAYPFNQRFDIGLFNDVSATLWFAGLCAACVLGLVRLFRREIFSVRQACVASMLLVIAFSLFVNKFQFGYRYFLPVTGFLAMFLGMELAHALKGRFRKLVLGAIGLMVLTSAGSAIELGRMPSLFPATEAAADALPEAQAVPALCQRLLSEKIAHVYCLDPMFQWNLMFESRERIRARWFQPGDRVPEYGVSVDRALLSGQRVAVVGNLQQLDKLGIFLTQRGQTMPVVWVIGQRYFIMPDPDAQFVQELGFEFNPAAAIRGQP
jgi:hypothetical protein